MLYNEQASRRVQTPLERVNREETYSQKGWGMKAKLCLAGIQIGALVMFCHQLTSELQHCGDCMIQRLDAQSMQDLMT